ncbi:MAG: HAD family phosphatase [Patescibacteria group bacterium]
MIKAVIFDWGGVCCSEGEPFASVALQKALGLTPDEIAQKVLNVYLEFYRGKYTTEDFWHRIMAHFALTETEEINPAALSQAYLNSYTLYPDMLDYARGLQKKYRVGLLSNLTPVMRDHIRRTHPVSEVFPVEVYSCDAEVAEVKPDPKPYQIVLNRLGVPPTEAFFIDNSKNNIVAAEALGIKSLLFQNREQFFRDMKDF